MRNRFESTLKRLSSIHSPKSTAISFYYFPRTPQNKAHREAGIVIKDRIRESRKRLESEGKRGALADLERISNLAEEWRNSGSPKAAFACAEHGIIEVVDLPDVDGETAIYVNSRFHLRPLSEAGTADGNYL